MADSEVGSADSDLTSAVVGSGNSGSRTKVGGWKSSGGDVVSLGVGVRCVVGVFVGTGVRGGGVGEGVGVFGMLVRLGVPTTGVEDSRVVDVRTEVRPEVRSEMFTVVSGVLAGVRLVLPETVFWVFRLSADAVGVGCCVGGVD